MNIIKKLNEITNRKAYKKLKIVIFNGCGIHKSLVYYTTYGPTYTYSMWNKATPYVTHQAHYTFKKVFFYFLKHSN